MTAIRRILRTLRSEEGIALPSVFALGLVMLMLVGTAMSVTTSGLQKTNTDEDYNGALAAAYAGIEEYQSRLSNDATYTAYGNPASTFTAGSPVVLPSTTNKALGLGTTGTWADIPGTDVDPGTGLGLPSGASFRYEVNTADYADKGVIHLRSTGRVGNVTRSIVADLKQDGFIDYLYFTNYEQIDPKYLGQTHNDSNGKNVCERYAYEVPTRDTSPVVDGSGATDPTGCGASIQFGANDVLTGPVRSNDQLLVACGAKFTSSVTSASTPPYKLASGSCSTSPFAQTPTSNIVIDMPPTNSDLKRETRSDLSDIPRPGCLYTGPTVITFLSGGMMNVYSPWTIKTQTTATTGSAPAVCGIPGSATGSLGGKNGATIPVLERNLIFVQPVPAAGSADPNAPAVGFTPPGFKCEPASTGSGSFDSKTPAGWSFKDGTTVKWAFPTAGETMPSGGVVNVGLTHYNCKGGDAYVKGTLTGQMTIASDYYIYVIGDLKYSSRTTDVLGLVANEAIFVWNPVKYSSGSWTALNGTGDREIDAAMLSVGHTFQTQNFSRVNLGTLTVFGAIAQKFRGSVALGSNGYVKDYQYDTRFRSIAPPKFLTPVSTTYGVTQYAMVPPAFKPSGAAGP